MITPTNEHAFDDPGFELRIEELLNRRAQEVDLSGLSTDTRLGQAPSAPSRFRYLAVCAALTLAVSSAFVLHFGQQSGDTPDNDLAVATESDAPPPVAAEEPKPVREFQAIETVDVQGITINVDYADQLEALLVDAKAAGFELSGAGYRDSARQVELRKANCGTTDYDIYEKPASECHPPTAIPGVSKHEQGAAVDFTVDGSTVRAASPEYEWLTANADTYGMVGNDYEPWHWEFGEAQTTNPENPDENSTDEKPPESPLADEDPEDAPIADSRVVSIPDEDLRTINGMKVHVDIAEQLQAMVDAALIDGIELTGGGYRDPSHMIEVRKANCGTTDYDIYEKPASECSPPTARPGSSTHEQGIAVDFTSDGHSLTRESPEYIWLTANADRYGLQNLPPEPWHWSTNGE